MAIKNLILDLGGVLYDLDYIKTQDALDHLGLGKNFSQLNQSSLFDDIEEGKVSPDEFIEKLIASSTKSNVSPKEIVSAWNAMLIGMPREKFELLEALGKQYKLYLYSNTNAIHIKAVWEHYKEVHGVDNLDNYFIKVYLSNELGIRKPKEEGFNHIVRENYLVKEETLFIDDSPQHIEGAISSGIKALWLDLTKEDLSGLLSRNGLLA